jgi:hypothetical protein
MLLQIMGEVLVASAVLLSPVFVALVFAGLNHELTIDREEAGR